MILLKHLIIGITVTIFLTSVFDINAANKAAPKMQFVKKTYNQTNKKQTIKTVIVQTREFKVAGILAWSEAKRNGFKFSPSSTWSGQIPDGTSTEGSSFIQGSKNQCKNPDSRRAQTLGGVSMILKQCGGVGYTLNTYADFNLFFGKKLKTGWTIKSMTISSNAQWTNEKWRANTNNIATKIRLTNNENQRSSTIAQLKGLILIGPKDGHWQDAFDVI